MSTTQHNAFDEKWKRLEKQEVYHQVVDEKTLFTDVGDLPVTQRQLNLYYYFLFIKERFAKVGAQDVLEVGCGRGTLSLFLAKYLGLQVSLLDDVPEAIDIAKKAFTHHKQDAQYYLGDALALDFSDEQFDGTVSIGLAEHLDDVESLFREQYRVLRSDGVMISLNIPKKFSVQSLNTAVRFIKKLFGRYTGSVRKDYYRNSLTPEDYADIARKVGFTGVEIVHVAPFPVFTPLSLQNDKRVTRVYKLILAIKHLFQPYPYKTNKIGAQAHFLVGYKH